MIMTLRIAAVLVFGGGALLISGSFINVNSGDWPIEFFTSGTAMVVVALTAGVALHASVRWERQRAREVHAEVWSRRSAVYEEVAVACVRGFTGEVTADLAEQRALIALWASPQALEAFAKWFRLSRDLATTSGGVLQDADKPNMYSALFLALSAARQDLADEGQSTTVTQDQMMRMIFNDYDSLEHGSTVA